MDPQAGLCIRLLQRMEDPYRGIDAGEEGTITYIDDARQIHVDWDNGSRLAIIPEIDHYEVLNLVKPLLDFEGMTPEQIEEFIVNTQISYEVDASIETQIDINGCLHKEQPNNMEASEWLSGTILGMVVSSKIEMPVDDAYIEALKIYKQANFDLEIAADDFYVKWGPLQ